MDDLRATIRLDLDNRGFVGEVRVADSEIEKLSQTLGKTSGTARVAARATDDLTRSTQRAGNAFLAAHGRAARYVASIATVATLHRAAAAARRYADAWTQVSNAVRVVTGSEAAALRVRERLFRIAAETRAPVSAAAELYQRLALSAGELGASEGQLLAAVRSVGQSLAIQGSEANESAGALLQLSQAIGGGVVRAEEFNGLLDGAPVLLRTVARHLEGAGGSVARLRQLVNDGKVTSREFFAALLAGADDLEEAFGRTTGTIGQAFLQVDTEMTRLVGRVDEIAGVSAAASGALGSFAAALGQADPHRVAEGLELLGRAALVAAVAVGARLTNAAGAAAVAAGRAAVQTTALQIALGRMEGRSRAAAAGLLALSRTARAARGVVALLGGPLGVLTIGALAAWEFASGIEGVEETTGKAKDAVDALAGSIDDLTDAQRRAKAYELEKLLLGEGGVSGFVDDQFGAGDGLLAQRAKARRQLDIALRQKALISTPGTDESKYLSSLLGDPNGIDEDITKAQAKVDRLDQAIQHVEDAIARLRGESTPETPAAGNPPPGPPIVEPPGAADTDYSDFADADRALREARLRASDLRREAAGLLAEIGDELASPFDRAVREAKRWGEESRRVLLAAGASAEDLGAVEEVVQQRIAAARREATEAAREAARERLRAATDWRSGVVRALRGIEAESQDAAANIERAINSAFRSASDALADFVTGGKVRFADLANSIVRSFARMASDRATAWLFNAALSAFTGPRAAGNLGGITTDPSGASSIGGVQVPHAGGVVGEIGRRRWGVPPEAWAHAPRFHRGGVAGLRSDEVPAILEPGELVVSRDGVRAATRAAPTVVVNVENRGSAQQAEPATSRWDGEKWVVDVVLDDFDRRGPIRRSVEQIAG